MATLIIIGICLIAVVVLVLRAIYDQKCRKNDLEAEIFDREVALYRALLRDRPAENTVA